MIKLILIVAVVAVIAALLLARRGPRITHIEHRRDDDRDQDSGA